jgi:hypothetical protein
LAATQGLVLDAIVNKMTSNRIIAFFETINGDEKWRRIDTTVTKTSDACVLSLYKWFNYREGFKYEVALYDDSEKIEVVRHQSKPGFEVPKGYCVSDAFCFKSRSGAKGLVNMMTAYQNDYCKRID